MPEESQSSVELKTTKRNEPSTYITWLAVLSVMVGMGITNAIWVVVLSVQREDAVRLEQMIRDLDARITSCCGTGEGSNTVTTGFGNVVHVSHGYSDLVREELSRIRKEAGNVDLR